MGIRHLWTWQNAAWREAARLRHPEIDLDHLYLGLLARPRCAVRYRQYVSAAPAVVAEVIADPDVLTTWAVRPEGVVQGDGQDVRTRSGRGSRAMTLRWTVERSTGPDGPVVAWRRSITGGPHEGQPQAYDRFELRPQDLGSVVIRTQGCAPGDRSGACSPP